MVVFVLNCAPKLFSPQGKPRRRDLDYFVGGCGRRKRHQGRPFLFWSNNRVAPTTYLQYIQLCFFTRFGYAVHTARWDGHRIIQFLCFGVSWRCNGMWLRTLQQLSCDKICEKRATQVLFLIVSLIVFPFLSSFPFTERKRSTMGGWVTACSAPYQQENHSFFMTFVTMQV